MRKKSLLLTIFFSILFHTSANCYDGMFFTTQPSTIIFTDNVRPGLSFGLLSERNNSLGFGNRICGGFPNLNFGKISLVSKEDVLSQYNLKALEYISFEKLSSKKRLEILKSMSSEYCKDLINSMKELKKKFDNDKSFRKKISSLTEVGEFETTKRKQSWFTKITRPWKKSSKDHAIMQFANHVKEQAKQANKIATRREQEDKAKLTEIYQNSFKQLENLTTNNRVIKKIDAIKKVINKPESASYKNYNLNSCITSVVGKVIDIESLKNCYGNIVQQNIHGEVVDSLNDWSQVYSSNRNLGNIENYSQLVVSTAKKALGCKEERNYKSAYFFSDLCTGVVEIVKHGILGVAKRSGEALGYLSDGCKGLMYACSELEIGRTAGYLLQRIGYGLEDSSVDILNCLKKTKSCLLGLEYEPIKYESYEHKTRISQTCLVEKLEGLGNFLQCASRSLVDGSAILVSALAVACIAEPFLPAMVAGATGQTAFNLSGDGALQVVSEDAVPVGKTIATALAEVMPFCEKFAEGVAHFFAGGDPPTGGKGFEKSSWVASDGRKIWYKTSKIKRQMKKRGWSQDDIDDILTSYKRRFRTTIQRRDKVSGKNVIVKDGDGTVFFKSNDEYVIISNDTNELVQVSKKSDVGWVPDWNLWTEIK